MVIPDPTVPLIPPTRPPVGPLNGVVQLVLAATSGVATLAQVNRRLAPWPFRQPVADYLGQLMESGWLVSRPAFSWTPEGEALMGHLFGGAAFSSTGPTGRLAAPALGLAGAPRRDHLADPEVLRWEVIRQAYELPVPPLASPNTLNQAMLRHLWQQGATARVVDHLGVRLSHLSGRHARAVLWWSELDRLLPNLDMSDVTRYAPRTLIARAKACLVAQWTGSSDPRPRCVTQALVARWLGRSTPSPEQAERAELTEVPLPETEVHASQVLQAARTSPSGRFGDRLVFISHTWRHLQQTTSAPSSLDHFKTFLLEAHQRGDLSLKAAAMPQLHDPSDLAESEVCYRSSRFHFIRI